MERVAKALADPRRFDILERIAASSELPCKALVNELPVAQATISHHLKELSNAGLIDVRREAQYAFCRFCPEVFEDYLEEMQTRLPVHASR